MDLVNTTKCDVQATQAVDKTGHAWLVVMAKATYRIDAQGDPEGTGPARLADTHNRLRSSDVFAGEPGLSAPRFESDMVPFKPACDVVVNGSAHVPWQDGRPLRATELDVGLRVTTAAGQPVIDKRLRVHGRRLWRRRLGGWRLGPSEPFESVPVSYELAFGGSLAHTAIGSTDPQDDRIHPMNPVGRGYATGRYLRLLEDAPSHQLDLWVQGRPMAIDDPTRAHPPAGLGPVARHWQPRLAFGGTYDAAWRDEVFPLLPADFDERFYQCAPPDQQMPYPQGGTVTLTNLSPAAAQDAARTGGRLSFALPRRALPIGVLTHTRDTAPLQAVIDTVMIDTDAMTFDVTWRARLALRRGLHDVLMVAVGPASKRWWQGQAFGDAGCCGCGGELRPPDAAAPAA